MPLQLLRHRLFPTSHSGELTLLQVYCHGDALFSMLFTYAAIETLQLGLRCRPQVTPLIATVTPGKTEGKVQGLDEWWKGKRADLKAKGLTGRMLLFPPVAQSEPDLEVVDY